MERIGSCQGVMVERWERRCNNISEDDSLEMKRTVLSDCESEYGYSNEPGKAFFFNYIDSCQSDVVNLKSTLCLLGWLCEDVQADSVKDLREIQKRAREEGRYPGTVMVFFFGYGYDSYLFLGSSTKESFSFEAFYCELKKFQTEGDALILFTNACYKEPELNTTYEYVEVDDEPVGHVFHFCTQVYGQCQKGSLMTHVLLNNMETSCGFIKLAKELDKKINEQKHWGGDGDGDGNGNGDEYFVSTILHGVYRDVFVNFKSPSFVINQ